MKTLGMAFWVVVGLCLACLVSPQLRAEDQSNGSSASTAELSRRLEDLQKEVERLQGELASVKKQLSASGAAPAPSASAPAPTDAPAPAGQEATPATSLAASAPPATPAPNNNHLASLLGSTSLSGFIDTYYGYNFNQPHSRTSGLRAFDGPSNQFALNLIELILDKPPDASNSRLGYRIALGYGQAMNVVNSTDPGGVGFAQYLKEAYFSYLAPVGKGLQLDFGKFVTPHGAEVIETKDNLNYSRGLLFTYGIPFYHFGVRAKYTFNDKYWFGGSLVNGWNNIVDNNTGKTAGVSFGWNPSKKLGIVQNYMAGPELAGTNASWRQLSDTLVTITPNDRLTFIVNYDYGRGDRPAGLVDPVMWTGVAGYVRYAFNERFAIVTRYEYFNDHDGFTTGIPQHINEFTGTFEQRIARHLLTRWEFRRDVSNRRAFLKGDAPVAAQNTMTGGLVYVFDTRESQ